MKLKYSQEGEICEHCNSLCTDYIYECAQTGEKLCHDCALVSNVNGAGQMTGKYGFKSREVQKKEIIWKCTECNKSLDLPNTEPLICPHCGNNSSWKFERIYREDEVEGNE